jgi:para-aminobenzoate synthetase/4-amino-4-deoxychorismate lyase
MEIIRELEPDPRGIYTGCIGWLAPGRQATFSVAIRTVAIDRRTGTAEYGAGGGIVWDSDCANEFAECETKAAVLAAEVPQFELLETLLHRGADGYDLLEGHLRRLAKSAEYFDFAVDLAEVRRRLLEVADGLGHRRCSRVRLRLGRQGQIAVEAGVKGDSPIFADTKIGTVPWILRLAPQPIDPRNVFLYHKTTWRAVYEQAYASRGKCDDVILWNPDGQATETTIANLVVEKAGRLVTPPVGCGLLPGVFRQHLLDTGQVCEDIVTLDDLRQAQRLFAVNSVRGQVAAILVMKETR